MTIGDGHDLKSPRFSGDLMLEACFDEEYRMQIGETGEAVKKIQQALLDLGYELAVDGIFGEMTREKIALFKSDQIPPILPSDGVVGPKTMAALDELFKDTISATPVTIEALGCPPPFVAARQRANDYNEYVELVMCLERSLPSESPRRILSLLRQIYYSSSDWDAVVTCGIKFANLDTLLTDPLIQAIHNSQVIADPSTQEQIDMGHVFTGLEAMCCPRAKVVLERLSIDVPQSISNEEWATWVGDLGSAAAQKLLDEGGTIGLSPKAWDNYFGPKGTLASFADMEGDIDSYAIRQVLVQKPCENCALASITDAHFGVETVSSILDAYYNGVLYPFNTARANKFHCFAQALGCQISGKHISNRDEVRPLLADRIHGFSRLWALKQSSLMDSVSDAGLQVYSIQLTDLFLHWIESRL